MKTIINSKLFLIVLLFLIIAFGKNIFAQKQFSNYKYIGGISPSISNQQIFQNNNVLRDTILSFPTPGIWPGGLAWDGGHFWICSIVNSNSLSYNIFKATLTGEIVDSLPMPDSSLICGGGLEWDGSNLWLADEQSATLFKIDTSTGIAIEQFNLPSYGYSDPNGFGLAWDGEYLWHSQYGDSAMIFKLDPTNGQVISSFTPPKNSILGITYVEDYLYGINGEPIFDDSTNQLLDWNATIYKFETSSGIVLDSLYWEIPYPLGLVWDGSYFWNISSDIDFGGNERVYKIETDFISIDENSQSLFKSFYLSQNFPNPFNPMTTISYSVPHYGFVELLIYNLKGQLIETLKSEFQIQGNNSVIWNADDLSSGIYFYQVKFDVKVLGTKRAVFLK